ncbi:MAG: hypothetical protein RLO50_14360 [Azospirillaceae bacterium]
MPSRKTVGWTPAIRRAGLGLAAACLLATAANADDKPGEAATADTGVGSEVTVEDVTMVMVERWGPVTGGILEGDGTFFLGEEPPIHHQDRIWTDRWLDLATDQVLIVTVWSEHNRPMLEVRNGSGTPLPALSFSQLDGARIATQLEFYPPDDGAYRVLLTSQDRFQDLLAYEVDAGVWEVVEEEEQEEEEEDTDTTIGDEAVGDSPFTDFNNPPPVR